MKKTLLFVLLMPIHFCIGQNISLIKDINPGSSDSYPSLYGVGSSGTQFCFWADNGTSGNELWITDGTAAGTHLVCDLLTSGSQQNNDGPVYLNGNWYFSASDGVSGIELWKTDGTICTLIKDINSGVGNSNIEGLTVYNNAVYFRALNGNGINLWKSDGTTLGTVLIDNAFEFQGTELIEYNAKLYFYGKTGTSSGVLVTDGSNIQLVKEISSSGYAYVADLTPTSLGLFFIAADDVNGREVWITDGTDLGTHMVKDINPSGNGRQYDGEMTFYNGALYFDANDGTNGYEVWKSDGTAPGTVMFKDINPSGNAFYPGDFRGVVCNGNLYFVAADDMNNFEVWKSDGSAANTQVLTEINIAGSSDAYGLYVYSNELFFAADDGVVGNELWKSDGTAGGTLLVEDLNVGTGDGVDNLYFMVLNNELLFPASNGATGFELYKYNSTTTAVISSAKPTSLQLYPNPASTYLTISTEGKDLHVAMYNAQGIMIQEYKSVHDKELLDISTLDKGLYLVQVNYQDGSSEQVKVIKE
jgi:ELWxxDGT repeat protein